MKQTVKHFNAQEEEFTEWKSFSWSTGMMFTTNEGVVIIAHSYNYDTPYSIIALYDGKNKLGTDEAVHDWLNKHYAEQITLIDFNFSTDPNGGIDNDN